MGAKTLATTILGEVASSRARSIHYVGLQRVYCNEYQSLEGTRSKGVKELCIATATRHDSREEARHGHFKGFAGRNEQHIGGLGLSKHQYLATAKYTNCQIMMKFLSQI